jgi:excisionase family DNA binding protein
MSNDTPWLTVKQAAERAQVGPRLIYREVRAGRLKAARVGGRRELRFLPAWVDAWLESSATACDGLRIIGGAA